MRYVFLGDIHGEYYKMIQALTAAKFDSRVDILVLLGDIFDRGYGSKEVLEFINGIEHKICIAGNHDTRLRDLYFGRDSVNECDVWNGVAQTMATFTESVIEENVNGIRNALNKLRYDDKYKEVASMLEKYFDSLVYAIDIDGIMATHGVLPHYDFDTSYYKRADKIAWEAAGWGNTQVFITYARDKGTFRQIILGHWHTFRLRKHFGDAYQKVNSMTGEKNYICSKYVIDDKFVCLDGCSNIEEGVVNYHIIESDKKPTIYDGRI